MFWHKSQWDSEFGTNSSGVGGVSQGLRAGCPQTCVFGCPFASNTWEACRASLETLTNGGPTIRPCAEDKTMARNVFVCDLMDKDSKQEVNVALTSIRPTVSDPFPNGAGFRGSRKSATVRLSRTQYSNHCRLTRRPLGNLGSFDLVDVLLDDLNGLDQTDRSIQARLQTGTRHRTLKPPLDVVLVAELESLVNESAAGPGASRPSVGSCGETIGIIASSPNRS